MILNFNMGFFTLKSVHKCSQKFLYIIYLNPYKKINKTSRTAYWSNWYIFTVFEFN